MVEIDTDSEEWEEFRDKILDLLNDEYGMFTHGDIDEDDSIPESATELIDKLGLDHHGSLIDSLLATVLSRSSMVVEYVSGMGVSSEARQAADRARPAITALMEELNAASMKRLRLAEVLQTMTAEQRIQLKNSGVVDEEDYNAAMEMMRSLPAPQTTPHHPSSAKKIVKVRRRLSIKSK